jgi:hypothetical protein
LPAARRAEQAPAPAEEDYTSRLLKAKRNVRYGRGESGPGLPPQQGSGGLPDKLPDDLN